MEFLACHLDTDQGALESRFGRRPPRFQGGPTDLLPAPAARWIAGKLLGTPWFARNVVVNRWFVHTDEPPLQAAV